ncbi:hypothetical protein J1N35_024744 [Gossypium stocksii]|uniref:Uncharacterized protein n=1 Tax=Gossypium stocksii TaxID=47602 RepID=A0A9D3V5B3_9ROSI|nr:hypothetical protein J1N35_024744 [Gossypium stocksii]
MSSIQKQIRGIRCLQWLMDITVRICQLSSFHRRVFNPEVIFKPLYTFFRQCMCNCVSFISIVAAGIELVDAYSLDTIIASFLGKEVHDPWALYLYAALLCQAFAHCEKFPTATSRRNLGRVLVPVWLIVLSNQLLIIALTKPAQNCLSFQGITCIHALHIRLEFTPRNIAIPTPHVNLTSLLSILIRSQQGARQNRKTHIGFRDNQARTDDLYHVKVTLYR